jgi:uncharacterized protein
LRYPAELLPKKIINTMEFENILKTKSATQFGRSSHFTNLEQLLRSSLSMLQLETTEKCNLRCGYCVYSGQLPDVRQHSKSTMSIDIAFRAIDYLAQNSVDNDEISITFYGGEPLINFKLIKQSVEYSIKKFDTKELYFSMTTNATLLTKEIAEFLARTKNFTVVVSCDGPQEIHDKYRKNTAGEGSFKLTMQGLRNLKEAFGKNFNSRVGLSMVYAPPYSETKLNTIKRFLDACPVIPKKSETIFLTYPRPGSIPLTYESKGQGEDKSFIEWATENFIESYLKGSRIAPVIKNPINSRLLRLFKRQVFSQPVEKYSLNGCCIPGVRKIFVTAKGDFHICERVHGAPPIGNVNTGIDLNVIKKIFVQEYAEKSLMLCSNCWAINLCRICYESCFFNQEINIDKKLGDCRNHRSILLTDLKLFCALLEKNPEGLNYLDNFTVK